MEKFPHGISYEIHSQNQPPPGAGGAGGLGTAVSFDGIEDPQQMNLERWRLGIVLSKARVLRAPRGPVLSRAILLFMEKDFTLHGEGFRLPQDLSLSLSLSLSLCLSLCTL